MGVALERNIGKAERVSEPFDIEEGEVAFRLPYTDEYDYKINLDDEDLDFLLSRGFAKILGEKPSSKGLFSAGVIDLGSDLPLLVDPKRIHTEPGSRGNFHGVHMDVLAYTMSKANEHSGVLIAERNILGKWSMLDYVENPPLREPSAIQTGV